MAGVITTGNHPKLMWPGIKGVWGRTYTEHPLEAYDLFDEQTSDKNYEEVVEVTGFGLAPVKRQGAGVAFDSETQGTVSRFTNVSIALGYIVTKEELDDNLYEQKARPRAISNAFSMRQSKEVIHANVYNNGFDAAYPGGDGVELFSAAHPTRTGVQSNLLTAADISEAAIEDALIQIMLMTNSRGLKISLIGQSLHVHPSDWFEANRILKSVLQNDTANNAVNVIKSTGALPQGIKVNHYFDDSDAWFIRTNAPQGMISFTRQKAALTRDNDFNTGNAKAKTWERYVPGWGDWRAAVGNQGV